MNGQTLIDKLSQISDFAKYYQISHSSTQREIVFIYKDENGVYDCRGNFSIILTFSYERVKNIEIKIDEVTFEFSDTALRRKYRFISDILKDQLVKISEDTSVKPQTIFISAIESFVS